MAFGLVLAVVAVLPSPPLRGRAMTAVISGRSVRVCGGSGNGGACEFLHRPLSLVQRFPQGAGFVAARVESTRRMALALNRVDSTCRLHSHTRAVFRLPWRAARLLIAMRASRVRSWDHGVLGRERAIEVDCVLGVELSMSLPVPFISRVRLVNYKSIAECDVRLGPLTVLVGPNGAGKSNFLDALRFVADAIAFSPDQAIAARGGLGEILRRGPQQAGSFAINLEVTIPWGSTPAQWARGRYGFEIASADRPGQHPFLVTEEYCDLLWNERGDGFTVRRGHVEDPGSPVRETDIDPERLYLSLASVRPNLAPLYAGLRGMYFYDPDPHKLRDLYAPGTGEALGREGENLGDVLGALDTATKDRFDSYMRVVVPELASVERKYQGSYVTVELRTRPTADTPDVAFGPRAMSDGTIRAAGLLAALFQPWARTGRIRLIGIEEPELAVHPAAAGALFDALTETSEQVQVVVTTQSPDLLDRDDVDAHAVRVANIHHGFTVIGEIDRASQRIVGEKLATIGQLLRGDQLSPAAGE